MAFRLALLGRVVGLGLLAGLGVCALGGCSMLGYYQQAVVGQLRLLHARDDVAGLLARPDIDPQLRLALIDAQAVLQFAEAQLGLKADGRYSDYVALERPFVVWNLVVAPVDSVVPRHWCFPVAGCVSYRGYFDEQRAQLNAQRYDPSKFDTYVGGVPAYSTLGWFDDPLLSSFIHWPQPARAELLFHELAHGRLYVSGDTAFNESFATFVAEYALPRYLGADSVSQALQAHRARKAENRRFNHLLLDLRTRLGADFAAIDPALTDEARRTEAVRLRNQRYGEAAACFAKVEGEFNESRWGRIFEQPPNLARLSLVGAYHGWVDAFAALFAEQGDDLVRFFAAAESIADLSPAARLQELERLARQARLSEQKIQAEGDHQYPNDIQCEALTDHAADRHMTG